MRTLALACLLLLCANVQAHKSSDSYLDIAIDSTGHALLRWDIALRDLDLLLPIDADLDRKITWGEVQAATPSLYALAISALSLRRADAVCTLGIRDAGVRIQQHVDGQYAVLSLQGDCGLNGALGIDYRLLEGVDADHRGMAHVREASRSRTLVLVPGEPVVLDNDQTYSGFASYVREGVHHIATGFDHLLFLLSLLLPVALAQPRTRAARPGRALRDTAVLVTAFTLAHSLTLALASLGLVTLSTRFVEAAIAASVVIAALHNLAARAFNGRWLMAFVFGLVHGFGFAAMMQALPAGAGARALALLGFNLGVELGQMLAVGLFLPLALAVAHRHRAAYLRWGLHGGSLTIALVGLTWFCQRVFDLTIIPG